MEGVFICASGYTKRPNRPATRIQFEFLIPCSGIVAAPSSRGSVQYKIPARQSNYKVSISCKGECIDTIDQLALDVERE